MPVCNCSMFCCTLLYVHSSFAIILMGKRKLVALLSLSFWCLMMVVWLFLQCHGFVCCLWLWHFLIILTYYLLDSEYPLYLLYMSHKTGDLETWFTSLDSKWVLAGNASDQVAYCFGIWSWNNFAITKSDCNYCLPIFSMQAEGQKILKHIKRIFIL